MFDKELFNDATSGQKESHNPSGLKVDANGDMIVPSAPAELPAPELSANAITVLERRYLKKDRSGKVIESPKDLFWRVAYFITSNEVRYNPDCDVDAEAKNTYKMLARLDFVPNSPTLMNAGRRLGQLSACFVLPVEDSMEGIFEAVKNAALVHKSGGGTGFSFSRLRPKQAPVASTAGTASGPVSFMSVFNAATETIKQGGTRRGANMGILRVDHPDIRDFITCKQDNVSITNFNISVAVTDAFMSAVDKGGMYNLIIPGSGKVSRQENAREIFNLIANNAWKNGDPGMVFIDEINRHENTPKVGAVESTNPCGEQPLLPYESCNLGSINLNNMFLSSGEFDWDRLKEVTRRSVRFLDNIVDMNRYPIPEIHEMTHSNRRIGLGIMGFADLLHAMKLPYDSAEAVQFGKDLMKFIHENARQMSDELATVRGAFPNCGKSVFDHDTRNSTVTTIAPTGTISMIADTSGGIEPNFALVYVKRVMDDDRLLYVNNRFEEAARAGGWFSPSLMEKLADGQKLKDMQEVPEDAKRFFVTSHDIAPEWHIKMQAGFQEYVDNAVSKTINFPNSATIDDVRNAYLMAWKLKCKGITIYRDGSRDEQVMNVGSKQLSKDEKDKQPAITPRGSLQPRKRPTLTRGYTEQIETGEGTLYVTINEDDQGLCEVFASIGKSGGNAAAQSEAIGRLISIALRAGVDPKSIIKQLRGITGANPAWHNGKLIRSTPDAIGFALERYISEKSSKQTELPLINDDPKLKVKHKNSDSDVTYFLGQKTTDQCPECSGHMVYQGGCMVCTQCAFSKCE